MLRHPFAGHRRYSITHRAVQRLRELVPKHGTADDETLRDQLDEALATAEDSGRAIRTLDAMLGEPQTLIPVPDFGETLYAIIKEETVVTVLPRGHGEEILQRGQAMQQRVASGAPAPRGRPEDERRRSAWRPKDNSPPVVVERIVRGAAPGGGIMSRIESVGAMAPNGDAPTATTDARTALRGATSHVVELADRGQAEGPVAEALDQALNTARRRAAIAAVREILGVQHQEASILNLWNALAENGIPHVMTVGDLLDATRP